MSNEPLITFEEQGSILVGRIQATSVLDARNVAAFGSLLLSKVEATSGSHILLDFSQVSYLSSAVLNELLKVHRKLLETSGSLRLAGLNQDIRKVFEITNLDKVFVIYDSLGDGLRKFQRSIVIEAQERSWDSIDKKE